MISTIKQFFEKYVQSTPDSKVTVSEHSLQIATAALLIEMMRADAQISEDEKHTITNTMRSKFQLTGEEIHAILELAEEKIWESTGYFEFTSLMNNGFSHKQKLKVIEYL